MHSSILTLGITLLLFTSLTSASNIGILPLTPRDITALPPMAAAAARPNQFLKPRYHLKQVTRQQLLKREAVKKMLSERGVPPPPAPPAPSAYPPVTVLVAAGFKDDAVIPLPVNLPFPMTLFGHSMDTSTLQMSTNGFLRFGSGNNAKDNGKLPRKNIGDTVLFPYMDDLVLPNSNFQMTYTFTNKMVRFSWETTPFGVQSLTAYIHFELEYLVDTPNLLYIRYSDDSNPAFLNGGSATIGVQSVTEMKVYQYSRNNKYVGGGKLPASQVAAPGRLLIVDTTTGSFTMIG